MDRRSFLRLGAGATTALAGAALAPFVGRLVAEAQGRAEERVNLIVLTGGNGWGHQGMARDGEPLYTRVGSPTRRVRSASRSMSGCTSSTAQTSRSPSTSPG